MSYAEVCGAVEALQKKYHENDPFRLCEDMNILLLSQALGNAPDAIKGFYLESKRIRTITVNCDLPEAVQRIIVAHELGHAVLHRHSGIHAFHDIGLSAYSMRARCWRRMPICLLPSICSETKMSLKHSTVIPLFSLLLQCSASQRNCLILNSVC